ncbi:MAG TPA: DUF5320 domain-containing protein [Clostridia bacterium]|nr:DUF5320 domain-containing protein [Clostridia bacterium]
MPKGDRSGPMGMGPMTGRGAGFCADAANPAYANTGCGFGRGRGFGRNDFARGARMRGRFSGFDQTVGAPVDEKDEKEFLSNQAKALQDRLEEINKRLAEL